MKIVVIGKGTVGRALLSQLAKLDYAPRVALVAGKSAYITHQDDLSPETLLHIAANGFDGQETQTYTSPAELEEAIQKQGGDILVVDVTAASGEMHVKWRERGWHIVTANKKPLSEAMALYDSLMKKKGPYYRHEATVGAGLPIISTIESLHATGDTMTAFSGMLSGTMGAIFSACDTGMSFTDAVKKAKDEGFTEPDPRDDLSGMDIARKALILARLMGHQLEMKDLEIETLVPEALRDGSIDAFLGGLESAVQDIEERLANAKKKGNTLRYLAEGDQEKIKIGLVEVSSSHPTFGLSGPENLIVLHSARYSTTPITIRGPGAGAEVTAGGVLSDIIRITQSL